MPVLLYSGLNKKYKPGGVYRTLLWPGSWLMARVCAKNGGGVPFCMHIKTNQGYMKMHQGTQLRSLAVAVSSFRINIARINSAI